jgi:hypothetical protein
MGNQLKTVTEQYFSILNDYMREPFKIASEYDHRPEKYMRKLEHIYDIGTAKSILESMREELIHLDWDSLVSDIQKMSGQKSYYMGKGLSYLNPIFETSDFLKKTALYSDTIILKDDILTVLIAWKEEEEDLGVVFPFILQNALEFLKMQDLFFSDVSQPICALVPSFRWYSPRRNLEKRFVDCTM